MDSESIIAFIKQNMVLYVSILLERCITRQHQKHKWPWIRLIMMFALPSSIFHPIKQNTKNI